MEGGIIEEVIDRVQKVHEGGKIAMKSRVEIKSIGDVRKIYTPGVASILSSSPRSSQTPQHSGQ